MFGVALFCLWTNRHKKLRSLGNNVLEAFKISRICFFDLRGDLDALKGPGVVDFPILVPKNQQEMDDEPEKPQPGFLKYPRCILSTI